MLFPIIMLVFTLSYNSVFALYLVVSQLFGMATAPLINKLLSKKPKKVVTNTIIDVEPEKVVNDNVVTLTNDESAPPKKETIKTKNNTKGKTAKYPKKNKKGV